MKKILFLLPFMWACDDAIKKYHKEIKDLGFIPYVTPLQYAGTGTLVGGRADRLIVATSPTTCFPEGITEEEFRLRHVEETQLPERYHELQIGAAFTTSFLKVLGAGSPSISAGVEFAKVEEIIVKFEGATLEIIDTLRLKQFYERLLHSDCKDLLQRFGLIVEALRVEKMNIQFYNRDKGRIKLGTEKAIKDILELGMDIDWDVEDESKLVFNTPKYIGYRIARLQKKDKGVALMRATEVRNNKFVFKDVGLFEDSLLGIKMVGKGIQVLDVPPLH